MTGRPRLASFTRLLRRGSAAVEADVREEMETHVDLWVEHLVARGTPRELAVREARARFGAYDEALAHLYSSAHQRETRMQRRQWWDALRQDAAFALRVGVRERTFTVVALLTFALGIGANTAVYSVVSAVLLRPLPYAEPQRLVAVWPTRTISAAELEYLQANSRTLGTVSAFSPGWGIAMTGAGEPRQLDAARVSTNFFTTLGVKPSLGRAFEPGESEAGKRNVALISHALWTTQFGGDSAAIGRMVDMDGQPHRIVGIMPQGFEAFQSGVDAWLPLQIDRASPFYTGQTALAFGRLSGGSTPAAASTELATFVPRMRTAFGYTDDYARGVSVVDLHESLVGDVRTTLMVLLGAVALLVLIAAANVGNLLIVQAVGRERELTIRRALGASRAQLARQLIVQGVLLSLAGGILGLAGGALGMRLLKHLLPGTLPLLGSASIDWRVLAACVAGTLGAGLLLGLAPALVASGVDPDGVLRAGSAARGRRDASHVRHGLVVVEVAVAMMLVVGASLMAESLWRLSRVDLGFQPQGALTFRIQPSSGQVRDPAQIDAYFRTMTARLAAIPGVTSVGAAQHLPLSGFNWSGSLDVEAKPIAASAEHPRVTWRSVTGDYFEAMRVPLIAGRAFTSSDTRESNPVVIVNAAMAKRVWRSPASALGARIELGNGTRNAWATVVGVSGDVRYSAPDAPAGMEAYRPNAQAALVFMHYVLRTRGQPLSLAAQVRTAVRSLDASVPVAEVRALDDLLSVATKTRQTVALLLASFAALGLLLGAVGIYGVIAYGVSQRTRELGIRSALGASASGVVAMVVGEGARLATLGIALGVIGALMGARSLRGLVYGVETTDPLLYMVVAVGLAAVAVGASMIPAWRAAHVDPLMALRGD
jgi:putative ABC transport system permease protein